MFNFIKKIFSKKTNLEKEISSSLFEGKVKSAFKNKIDNEFLSELENTLLKADIGVSATESLIAKLSEAKLSKDPDYEEVKNYLKEQIAADLKPYEKTLSFDKKPYVILASGVNGSGKTTNLGKIANKLAKDGKKVIIVAADTFRAAASNQLDVWAKRAGVKIMVSEKEGGDPAALSYQALELAQKESYDVVLIDTAGRLQNNKNFMDQLGKIVRVIKKLDESAPHLSLLVVDGTTGQNAIKQLEEFKKHSLVNGLIVTKLDGTAKGGAVIPLTQKFNIPIFYIGIGEGIDDIVEFNAGQFVEKLL